ncbi:low affinity zinc transporter [Suhomyces tanzawaensis NRRL Y-17324]|uniref:Low affinity zinc transporter n=1 Tax=Suhomyces tanzawaensis NRRL Y-17324 TaxID=984487 RepID=A0A1E4SJR4_9ASCO|nr:low affinity zinc transporter [Suhomyces tanzawaensis NRRL Y-17324]ODV79744.1 low affinity zinc transporter [Suhomyces tanzawaensis NRRL Y-17324]
MIDALYHDIFVKRDTCEADNEYNGEHWGARISSVFVILVTSGFGTFFPVLSSRYSFIRLPPWCFFIAKYFGSGVIIATAFIHLLQPADEALSSECLTGPITEYPWAYAICLMTLFLLFFCEMCAYRVVDSKLEALGLSDGNGQGGHSHFGDESTYIKKNESDEEGEDAEDDSTKKQKQTAVANPYPSHFLHALEHQDPEVLGTPVARQDKEQYFGQLLNIFVLEFGVIFHSVFVGISLAVAGDEFVSLYIVLVFHQMFEGLGLGSRIAVVSWPKSKRWTPWILCLAYTLTTPISIAIGLGVRESYPPGSRRALLTNGCFDAISAGILFYTGIVELMAHEFLYSGEFKGKDGFRKMLWAYFVMCWGAGLMALLGKWA